jgi:indolepyruvate ferredoxin oxidoreductase alpha subunit
VAKYSCALLDKKKITVQVKCDTEKCKKCGMCMKPGCPAITKNADGTVSINDTMCNGCGLCEQLCKFGALSKVNVG